MAPVVRGSGVGAGTPGTVNPGLVPNEKVVLVMVVSAVRPEPVIVNVAVWLRKGL